jgi:hypothetical protein
MLEFRLKERKFFTPDTGTGSWWISICLVPINSASKLMVDTTNVTKVTMQIETNILRGNAISV